MSKILSASNADILNTVRANASLEYRSRIPEITDGNISKAMTELERYTPMWNEFQHNLLNVVGLRLFTNNLYENVLKPLKGGALAWGGMVEEYGMNLIKGEEYDKNDTNVFDADTPEIEVNWHRINRRMKYPLKINEDLLTEACYNEGGLSEFVTYIMNNPQTSAEQDEYLLMLELLRKYEELDGFANINVPNILTSADPETDGKKLVKAIMTWNKKAQFFRKDLNAAGIDAVANSFNLLTTPEIYASQNVDVLAAAFNMDKAQFMAERVIVIDEWPDGLEGTQALLLDKDFYRVYDTKNVVKSIYNPSTLDWIHYLHRWGIFSVSRMRPAIRFSTEQTNLGTITTKTVKSVAAATVSGAADVLAAGADIPLKATVTYSDNTTDERAYWILTGSTVAATADNTANVDVILPDTGTYVDRENVLHVSENSTYQTITATAVSTMDGSKNDTITLTAHVAA